MSSAAGLVTVEVDDTAGVTIGGIRDGATAGHLWLAALEAITDQIRDIDMSMTGVVGPHRNMVAAGGWSRSQALMRVKQRAFGEVIRSDVEETGARGAALLAGLAAGAYPGPGDFPGPDPTPVPEPATPAHGPGRSAPAGARRVARNERGDVEHLGGR
jgi:glycerol kinase